MVTLIVEGRFRCPQHGTLLEKLSKHYQLRDINSDPRRELTLVDLNDGATDGIRYGRPSLTEVLTSDLSVPGYHDATVTVTISRTAVKYSADRTRAKSAREANPRIGNQTG